MSKKSNVVPIESLQAKTDKVIAEYDERSYDERLANAQSLNGYEEIKRLLEIGWRI